MSLEAMTAAFKLSCAPDEKIVCLALADHANENGQCWPSMKKLAAKTSISLRTLFRVIERLEQQELIQRVSRNRENGGRTSNQYNLLFFTPCAKLVCGGPDPYATHVAHTPMPLLAEHETEIEPSESPLLLPSEDSPQTEIDFKTPARTPRAALKRVMSSQDAEDVITHRNNLGKPLTARAALGLAKNFAHVDDIPDAVEMMIVNGWQGFRPEWYNKSVKKNGVVSNGNQSQQFKTFADQTAESGLKYLERIASRRCAQYGGDDLG